MGNVRIKNKPPKVVKTTLEDVEVLAIIEEWGQGHSVSEVRHEHFLPEGLIQSVFNDCGKVQDACDELMKSDGQPPNEVSLKAQIHVLLINKSDEIVDMVIKYSDKDKNGNWDMYENFEWGTE